MSRTVSKRDWIDRLADELSDLRAHGDLMQSEASRLAAWARDAMKKHPTTLEMPYEVRMALLGLDAAIDDWTATRRRSR